MVSTLPRHSLADYVELLRANTSQQLISVEHFSYIKAIAQVLPSAMTYFFGLECPLGTPKTQGDFLVCTTTEDGGPKILGDRHAYIHLPDSLKAHPVWNQVQHFGQVWCKEDSALHEKIKNVWLEFDVDGIPDAIPVPSCFFGPGSVYSEPTIEGAAYHWITRQGLHLLRNQALPPAIEHKLFQCLDQLPQKAYVFQIGTMLARKADAIRICIRNIAPDAVGDYLKQLAWKGSVSELEALLAQLSALTESIDIDVDVGESIGPKIGLECHLKKQPKFEPRWESLLNYLVDKGLCVPEKKAGLLTYPGIIREKDYRDIWPNELHKLSQILGTGYEVLFFKGLHHIKVVHQSGASPVAKAYLSVRQAVLEKQILKQFTTQMSGLIWG
ncbi:MAG: hypothetical protein V7L22_33160 [Nostoc sp.]|uniref:hypothetical protein n=1 Tax=Nostoc sp. TaxID=1180 RepID=UPI002FF4758B